MEELKPCPFCGKKPSLDDHDTLYPSGIFWRHASEDEGGIRYYFKPLDRREDDGMCWQMHCPIGSGGCGAEITGDSREEAIAAWNRRAPSKAEKTEV